MLQEANREIFRNSQSEQDNARGTIRGTWAEFQTAPAPFTSPDKRSAGERAEWKDYDILDEFAADSEALRQSDPDSGMQSWPDDTAGHQHLLSGHWTQVINVIRIQWINGCLKRQK